MQQRKHKKMEVLLKKIFNKEDIVSCILMHFKVVDI